MVGWKEKEWIAFGMPLLSGCKPGQDWARGGARPRRLTSPLLLHVTSAERRLLDAWLLLSVAASCEVFYEHGLHSLTTGGIYSPRATGNSSHEVEETSLALLERTRHIYRSTPRARRDTHSRPSRTSRLVESGRLVLEGRPWMQWSTERGTVIPLVRS